MKHANNRQMARRHVRTGLLMAGAASMALIAGAAFAQDTAGASAPEENTVIVTAQKREQRLQDVPIVVTTLSAKLLQDAGVRDIKDMQILTPGLTVTSTQNETLTTARIRGVGTVGDNPGLESSVGVVIDGVYRPRNGVGFEDLGEMERIEVLKGPQGTLFGKNTSAGVINIITKKPSFTFGADGEASFGNFGYKGYGASVTGPLIADKLAGRLYVAHRERDGYTDVDPGVGPRTMTADQTQNFDTVRGQLLFTPNDDLDVRIIADYSNRDEFCCVAVQTRTGPTGAAIQALSGNHGLATTANPDARLAYSNRDTHQLVRDGGVSVEANLKLPNFFNSTLTSITGARDWKATNGQDLDYTGADILYRKDNGDFNAHFKTFSQEFRLAGATDRLDWLVGGFYVKEDLDRADSYVYGSAYEPYLSLLLSSAITGSQDPTFVAKLTSVHGSGLDADGAKHYAAGAQARDKYTQSDESYAFFTNDTWKITDKLDATVGLRYTSEKKSMTALYNNSDGGAACLAAVTRYQTAGALLTANGGNSAAAIGAGANPYWVGLVLAGKAPTIVGNMCPFWANFQFSSAAVGGDRKVADTKDDSDFSGTMKLSYHVTPDVMLYGSYARGYKAGGFNLDRAQTGITPDSSLWFSPETVDSEEIGVKSSLFGKAVLFNFTLFNQDYKNFQLNTFLGTAFVVESIPTLNSKGFDADVYWKTPIQGLSFQGGISYADTKYGKFTAADLDNPSHYPGLSLLPGAQVSFAPKWTSSASATWGHNFGNLRATANLTAKYSSKYNTGSDLIPYKDQEAFTIVNGRLGIGSVDRRWMVEFWAQNLTDQAYKQVVINGPLQGTGFQSTVQSSGSNPGTYYNASLDSNTYDAFLGAPRTYGMTLRLHY